MTHIGILVYNNEGNTVKIFCRHKNSCETRVIFKKLRNIELFTIHVLQNHVLVF